MIQSIYDTYIIPNSARSISGASHTMAGNHIRNRIAAFEQLAETSKAQSAVMQIVPNPATGFSSLKPIESVAMGKETYAALAVSSPYVARSYDEKQKNTLNGDVEIQTGRVENQSHIEKEGRNDQDSFMILEVQQEDEGEFRNPPSSLPTGVSPNELEVRNEGNPFDMFNELRKEGNEYKQQSSLQQLVQQPGNEQEISIDPIPNNNSSFVNNDIEGNQMITINNSIQETPKSEQRTSHNNIGILQTFSGEHGINETDADVAESNSNPLYVPDTTTKSFREILEEEDKYLDLDEEGPITEITMKSFDENEMDDDIDSRDADSVSPLSFMDRKIDDRRETKKLNLQPLNTAIKTIDEDQELRDLQPTNVNEKWNPSCEDANSSNNIKKPIMNPVEEGSEDIFACFKLEDQTERKVGIQYERQIFTEQKYLSHDIQPSPDDNDYHDSSPAGDEAGENQDLPLNDVKKQNIDEGDDDSSLLEYFENLLSDQPSHEINLLADDQVIDTVGLTNVAENHNPFDEVDNSMIEETHQLDDSDKVDPSPSAQLLESKFDDLWNEHTSLKSQSVTTDKMNEDKEDVAEDKVQAITTLTTNSMSLLPTQESEFLPPNNDFVQISHYSSTEQVGHEYCNSNINLTKSKFDGEGVTETETEPNWGNDFVMKQVALENSKISERLENTSAYSMYSSRSDEDELRPVVATVSLDINIQDNSSNKNSSVFSNNIEEQDEVSDTTPFAGISDDYDDILGELEEENFVNYRIDATHTETPMLHGSEEQHFSYLNQIPENQPQLESTLNAHIKSNNQMPSPDSNHHNQGKNNFRQGITEQNQHYLPENLSQTDNNPQSPVNQVQYMMLPNNDIASAKHKSSGPPLTFKNSNAFFHYDDGESESVGVSVLTEDTSFGTNQNQRRNFSDEASMMYSVSEKSHTSSTSISQGGQKPKKRPTSSNSDPSKPIPIFRTASALRDNPNLYHTNSTISELTGMDNMSVVSGGKRPSMTGTSNTQFLSTINTNSVDTKAEAIHNKRGVSPFGRRNDNESIVSNGTKSSVNQFSVANSEKTKQLENRKNQEPRRRRFSIRSLSPWRSFKKNQDDDELPYQFTNQKENTRSRLPRGRSKTRVTLQKTPSQMLFEEERAETSVPLVAVNRSQDSSISKKPTSRWSILRSLSPFIRFRSSSRVKTSKNDPFYEDTSL